VFLRIQNRRDLVRSVWKASATAAVICIVLAVELRVSKPDCRSDRGRHSPVGGNALFRGDTVLQSEAWVPKSERR
jgi:hypothetical protein